MTGNRVRNVADAGKRLMNEWCKAVADWLVFRLDRPLIFFVGGASELTSDEGRRIWWVIDA